MMRIGLRSVAADIVDWDNGFDSLEVESDVLVVSGRKFMSMHDSSGQSASSRSGGRVDPNMTGDGDGDDDGEGDGGFSMGEDSSLLALATCSER
jgi:hypothetical protein